MDATPSNASYAVFDHLIEGVQVLDFESRYLYLNDSGIRHSRSTRQALIGQRMADCYPGIDQTEIYALLQRCLTERVALSHVNPFTFPDGKTGYFELRLSPVPAGALILSYDISAQAELEQRLRHAERLESVGRLAGGIAHDFNNLLTVMVGYADLLRMELPAQGPQQESLAQILAAGSRASELTRQLLAFSRRQVLKPTVTDANAVVSEVTTMLARLLGAKIRMEIMPSSGPLWVLVDAGQFQQVIMNLALNARDAMPEGGRLGIATASLQLPTGDPRLESGAQAGTYAMLSVADNGQGMDAETLERLFEPFFSTKGAKGTGLGLATVHGIVKQSGGWIQVESEPGQGSRFQVYLPSSAPPAGEPVEPQPGASASGGRRVLLVDDQPEVLRLFEHVLAQAGYSVFVANNAANALAVCRQTAGGLDLLLTDLSLPDKNGRVLADEVRALRPGIKVLFSSGYSGVANGGLRAGESFIGKPVSPSKLVLQVQRILNGD